MSPSPPSGPRQLGPLLVELRAARGWSQQRTAAELCAAAGVLTLTRHEVSRWERQLRLPGDFWSVWLARVLGVPSELITEAVAHSRRLRRGPARTGNPAADPPPEPAAATDTAGRPARARGGTRAAGRSGRHSGARRGRPRPPARTGRPPQPGEPGSGRARAVPRRTARRGGDEACPAGTD
ncbi:helix-turn-helix domain-containing protein [Micromonospora sp. RP3T]|uniref:helix-turn-helix domain-containing protein n=1 Tax=Micromonospora sp. RP3T TaxID=2135446 RepID=UPI001E33ACC0|nr:helix-turn-helix transcriptional regulator [Micromonospora sp. RP3T]